MQEYCANPIPEVPHRPSYHFHWLALKGECPLIPENITDSIPTQIGMGNIPAQPLRMTEPKVKSSHIGIKTEDITKVNNQYSIGTDVIL